MGQSTNAILFYGFCWEEETREPWTIDGEEDEEEDEDWEARFARLKGLTEPEVPFPERRGKDGYSTPKDFEYTPEELAAKKAHVKYWDDKSKIAEKSGCEVDTHCSGECPMPYVAIKKSKTISYRGSMNEIKSLDVGEDWDVQLKEFCKLMGIKTKGKPKWWLVSDWN